MGRRFRHRDVLPGDAARGQLGRVNTLDTIAKAERVAGGPAVVEEVQTVAGGAWLARREDEPAERWRGHPILAVLLTVALGCRCWYGGGTHLRQEGRAAEEQCDGGEIRRSTRNRAATERGSVSNPHFSAGQQRTPT